jgi:hypothetical protein
MIKKNDKKYRFNLVDGLVLFLVVICIATVVCRAVFIENRYTPLYERSCKVDFEIETNDYFTSKIAESFKAGDAVSKIFSNISKNEKGEEVEELRTIIIGSLYEDLQYTDDSKSKMKGSIIVKGVLIENGVKIDGTEYKILEGEEFPITTEKISANIKVTSIAWEK